MRSASSSLAAGLQDVGDLAHGDRARADVAEAFVDRQLLLSADAQRLVGFAAGLQDVGDLAHGDRARADVAEAFVDRQLLLAADAQRLVGVAAGLQDVGDLAHGDRARADVAEAFVDRQLLLSADAQRLVGFAAGLQDVGDLAHGDRARADVAEAFVDRQLLLSADAQRLVGFAAGLQDVGDLAHGDRARADVAEAFVDRQLLLAADAQRLVGFAAGLQDVGDLAHGDRARADVAEAFVDRQLLLLADAQRLVGVAAVLQDVGDLACRNGDHSLVAGCLECGQRAPDEILGGSDGARSLSRSARRRSSAACCELAPMSSGRDARVGNASNRSSRPTSPSAIGAFDPEPEKVGISRIARWKRIHHTLHQRQRTSGRAPDPLQPRRAGETGRLQHFRLRLRLQRHLRRRHPTLIDWEAAVIAPPSRGQARQRSARQTGPVIRVERQRQRPRERVAGGVRRAVDLAEVVEQAEREQPPDCSRGILHPQRRTGCLQRRARDRNLFGKQRCRRKLAFLIAGQRRAIGRKRDARKERGQRVVRILRRPRLDQRLDLRRRHASLAIDADLRRASSAAPNSPASIGRVRIACNPGLPAAATSARLSSACTASPVAASSRPATRSAARSCFSRSRSAIGASGMRTSAAARSPPAPSGWRKS